MAPRAAELRAAGVGLMRAEFLSLQSGRHPGELLEEGTASDPASRSYRIHL